VKTAEGCKLSVTVLMKDIVSGNLEAVTRSCRKGIKYVVEEESSDKVLLEKSFVVCHFLTNFI
jgi:hypothetical protein